LVLKQKFGVLNGKMEQDPRFWGIQREKDGEKKVIKENLAKGCLSLQLGDLDTEAAKDFGATPPLQTFVKLDTLKQQILSIQMEKTLWNFIYFQLNPHIHFKGKKVLRLRQKQREQ
jgi:hypothetical protein